jgi:hypothetical protein
MVCISHNNDARFERPLRILTTAIQVADPVGTSTTQLRVALEVYLLLLNCDLLR